MKKRLIITLIIITIGIFLYGNFATTVYVRIQKKSICSWINGKQEQMPPVGPLASEHLSWLREEKKTCQCEIVEPNREFSMFDVNTILIKKDGIEQVRLNYCLSFGGRSFMQPIYFHHQADFKHSH